jgi:ABC-type branched-subunit amino acid transport system substrate-binding protein
MKNSVNMKKMLSLTIASLLAISTVVIVGSNMALAALNENDFKIKDFGIKDGKPWLTVEGKAGASKPDNASQIYGYAFVTDKGVFAVVSHGGVEDSPQVGNDSQWHTHKVDLDSKNCVTKLTNDGKAEVTDQIGISNITATKVDAVKTVLLGINNAGPTVCVEKVFDNKNSTQ